MIHFVTVHHYPKAPRFAKRFLRVQNDFIKKNAPEALVWACTNGGIEEQDLAESLFHRTFDYDPIRPPSGARRFSNHAAKYDFIVNEIRKEADTNDIIIFLDSDAWPVVDSFTVRLQALLARFKFVFIKDRAEDFPHAAFFATTLESWTAINGNWDWGRVEVHRADAPKNMRSNVSEMGANLAPLVGSPHSYILPVTAAPYNPDFHCVYGDDLGGLVYHHGAGSRVPGTFMPRENKLEVWGMTDKEAGRQSGQRWGNRDDSLRKQYVAEFNRLRDSVLKEIEANGMEKWGLIDIPVTEDSQEPKV